MAGIEQVTVESRLIAAVRRRVALEKVPKTIIPALGVVWAAVRRCGVAAGKNVVVYRDAGGGEVELLCGVEVADPFEDAAVECVETPDGTAARAIHTGAYRRLPRTYREIAGWMREHGCRAAGQSMEVYGHWVEDESRLRTEVYVFLQDE